jgi:hypothetical protein
VRGVDKDVGTSLFEEGGLNFLQFFLVGGFILVGTWGMGEARLGFAESGGGGGPAYHVTLFTSITLYKLCSTG